MSLGGVRDEAEIRGHRRTYIGSMPGKVIQSMRKAKTSNPLFLFDEVDKMGSDFRGDPSSALLEVLDPEQNHTFNDHYLEVDYDLSNVMFITTANTLNIPPPLMDRMEIIRIAGYTEDEKVEIARKHLIPNTITKHGLVSGEWAIDDEALMTLIRRYTREAGVRNLEREISNLARKAVKELMTSKKKNVKVTAENLADYLSVPKYRYGEVEAEDQIGVVTGLAWTDVGGELLTIEAAMMPGKGRMTVTGNLRDVMKESISAAASYVRSRAIAFGIQPPLFNKDVARDRLLSFAPNFASVLQWTPTQSLEQMDRFGIQTAMTSLSNPGTWFGDVSRSALPCSHVQRICCRSRPQPSRPFRNSCFPFTARCRGEPCPNRPTDNPDHLHH